MTAKSLKKNNLVLKKLKTAGVFIVSLVGAAGVALQNYMAIASLFTGLKAAVVGFAHSVAVALGSVCGGINLFINIDLLQSFVKRFSNKKKTPPLSGWKKFSYWFGSAIFVTTGILFGVTAFAFTPVGALAILGIIAGISVAIIMTIQELETWLQRFDDPETGEKKSIKQLFIEWKNSLTKGKVVGAIIAIGNVIALSLLFTMGLATFLMSVGIPALPALIVGFAVAFTAGAFTEFYFYNSFLGSFCDKIKEKWKAFKDSKWSLFGGICAGINAAVNVALTYIGITMIVGVMVAAGVAVPPVGVVIAVAALAAVFAGVASFILGINFWTNNIKKITDFFGKKQSEVTDDQSKESVPLLTYVQATKAFVAEPTLDVEEKAVEIVEESAATVVSDAVTASVVKHSLFNAIPPVSNDVPVDDEEEVYLPNIFNQCAA